MKLILNLLIVFFGLINLPFSLFLGFLLYRHVHATDLMWFLWWLTLPLSILTSVLSEVAKFCRDA